MTLAGHSAGGAMVLTLMRHARDAGLALPTGVQALYASQLQLGVEMVVRVPDRDVWPA